MVSPWEGAADRLGEQLRRETPNGPLDTSNGGPICSDTTYRPTMLRPELKKGSAEFIVLALLENEQRHGYDLARLIASRTKGVLKFHAASLYPLLYRLEKRGWIDGRWVEKANQRRRRYYRLTPAGKKILAAQRSSWREFVKAMGSIVGGPQHA